MCYFKKARVEEEDSPLPPSTKSTQPSSSDSLTHKKPSQALVAAAACSVAAVLVLSPGQPDAGLPADLTAIDEPPSQPNLKVFPCTVKNGKSRNFSSKWYGHFSWLEYSVIKDAIFCKMCRHFPSVAGSPFATEGFVDWKHLRQACEKHQVSKPHFVSLDKFQGYRDNQTGGRGNVLNQMNRDAMDFSFIERNRDHLKVVLDIVLFCAKQGIPLRGHRENEDALNKGNFIELFKFMCKYDPQIQNRLEQLPRNGTLLSPDTQNELLESAASLLLRKIKERAVGFMDTCDMSASGISEKILQVIEPLQLDPSLCVGFSFDGGSVMSGNKGGVHVILKKTFPQVITFFDTLNNIHSFMTGSSRHAKFVAAQKELHPGRPCLELERSTDTRWSSKSGAVSKVLTLLDVILEVLAEYAESSGQSKVEAQSLLQQIQTKKLLFLLVTFGKLFQTSDFATRGLQSPTLSVSECIDLIEGLKESFARFRDNSGCDFEQVMKLTEESMQKNEITSWDITAGTRVRKLPARLAGSVVTTSLGKATSVRNDDDLRHIWNDILDRQLAELDNCFQEDQYGIMRAAATFLPQSKTFAEKDSLRAPCDHFHILVEDAELTVFIEQLRRKVANGLEFPSLMEVLDICAPDIFPNINKLLQVIITLPMTSCSCERLFSTAGRTKTDLRAAMSTTRLNNLCLLSFEKELCNSLDYDEIISVFNTKPRRLRLVL
uniref:TTF-type domain-containing protein n=1 Tax=Sander lucioperca TaxID=283035 RepID=A0A8C9YWK2_SANLU